MGVLKNEVGRPTNKTLRTRTILRIILILIVVGVVFGLGYYFNKSLSNKQNNDESKISTTNNEKKLTLNDIQIKNETVNDGEKDYIYIKGKKLSIFEDKTSYSVEKNINILDDIAIFNLFTPDETYLVIVNSNAEILNIYCGSALLSDDSVKLTGQRYDGSYNISDNNIYIISGNYGQDPDYKVCTGDKNEFFEFTEKLTYKKGKLSKPEKISTLTNKEYIEKHNIDCSKL